MLYIACVMIIGWTIIVQAKLSRLIYNYRWFLRQNSSAEAKGGHSPHINTLDHSASDRVGSGNRNIAIVAFSPVDFC